MNINRKQWDQFCRVRDSGQYNMLTEWELAITETSLTKEEWFYITEEYLALEYRFSKTDVRNLFKNSFSINNDGNIF